MSALVGYRGGLGCRVVTFLKDSIGGTPNFIACQKVSHLCRAYLGMADFFVKTKNLCQLHLKFVSGLVTV